MVVVTTAVDGERGGCLVGFHSQCGIEPERYAVWLSKANHTYRLVLRSAYLGVHFLTDDDHDLARLFGTVSGDDTDKFADVECAEGPDGVPLLAGCAHRFVLRRRTLLDDGSDHVCFTGDILASGPPAAFTPLRLSAVRDLDAGHDADERPSPPTERAEE
jgi:flavin reductase (DIM6/NTAB) family NADH-FMN oxidoreductase RutF